MRLKLDSDALSGVRSLLEHDFASGLPDKDQLERAWADPLVAQLFQPKSAPKIGEMLQIAGVRAFGSVQGLVGINVGVPAQIVGDFAKSISAIALEDAEVNWAKLALEGGRSLVDTAMEAFGAIPIIGWVAKAVWGIASMILDLVQQEKPKPLLLTYDKEDDEEKARRALRLIGKVHSPEFGDWTKLFLPSGTGDWTSEEAANGFIVQPEGPGEGFGCIPPAAFGFGVVQVRGDAAELVEASLDVWGGNKKGSLIGDIGDEELRGYVENTWTQTPSLARVCNAVWAAMSTNELGAVFNVQPDPIRLAWEDFVGRGLEYADYQRTRARQPLGMALKQQLTRAPVKVDLPPGSIYGDATPARLRLDLLAGAWMNFLEERQLKICDTKAIAYASEDQIAFKMSHKLREKMIAGRQLLKTTLDANEIDLDDVLDVNLRNTLRDYKGVRSGHMPGNPPKTPALPNPGVYAIVGTPGVVPIGGGAALAGLGLVLAGMFALRR